MGPEDCFEMVSHYVASTALELQLLLSPFLKAARTTGCAPHQAKGNGTGMAFPVLFPFATLVSLFTFP